MALPAYISNVLAQSRLFQVFGAAVLPFIENKGAIVLAASLKLKWYAAFLASTLGAYLPVPFLLRVKASTLRRRLSDASSLCRPSVRKAGQRCRRALARYGHWGIFLVLSIPFTGVGCWLSAILANLGGINRRRSDLSGHPGFRSDYHADGVRIGQRHRLFLEIMYIYRLVLLSQPSFCTKISTILVQFAIFFLLAIPTIAGKSGKMVQ